MTSDLDLSELESVITSLTDGLSGAAETLIEGVSGAARREGNNQDSRV